MKDLMYTIAKTAVKFRAPFVVAAVMVLGTILLIRSHAATATVAVEPETGTLNSEVTKVTDSSASNGQAVQFGALTTQSPVSQYPVGCSGTLVPSGTDVVAAVNNASTGATLCIATGVYKISSQIVPKTSQTLWGNTGTVIDGSKTVAGWTQQGSIWIASTPLGSSNGGGQCEDNVTNPCLPTGQVFRNDVHLARVMSAAAVGPGKFFADYTAGKLYIGDDPTGQRVEIALTDYAVHSSASGVTVKGLTIEKFASPAQKGTLWADGPSWQIRNNTIRWNHAAGIFLSNTTSTVVDSNTIVENGQIGVAHYSSPSAVVSNNEIARNNTDGFWIADWESGGYKTTNSTATFSKNNVHDNKGVGVWVDVDGKGVTIDSNTIANNAADGIRYEISYDGIIKNNTVTGNGYGLLRGGGTSLYAVAGINVNTSSNVEIFGNTVSNNENGIGLQMRNRGSGKYGAWLLVNCKVHNNIVTMKTGTTYGEGASGLVQNVSDNSYFTSQGNSFYDNSYFLDSLTAKRFAWNNTYNTAATWRADGQDVNGSFQ